MRNLRPYIFVTEMEPCASVWLHSCEFDIHEGMEMVGVSRLLSKTRSRSFLRWIEMNKVMKLGGVEENEHKWGPCTLTNLS